MYWNMERVQRAEVRRVECRVITHQLENLRDTGTGADLAVEEQLAGRANKERSKLKTGVQHKI